VRPADQPLQREDLSLRLVLAGVDRRADSLVSVHVGGPCCVSRRPLPLRAASPASDGSSLRRQGGAHPATRHRLRRQLPSTGRRLRATTAWPQHQRPDGDRASLLTVGQLPAQKRRHFRPREAGLRSARAYGRES